MTDVQDTMTPEEIGRRAKWIDILLVNPGPMAAAALMGLAALFWVWVWDAGVAAWFAGLLASVAAALGMVGILYKVQVELKRDLVDAYEHQLALQEDVRRLLEEQREANKKHREWMHDAISSVASQVGIRVQPNPRQATGSRGETARQPTDPRQEDDDPPDAIDLLTKPEIWWMEHQDQIKRLVCYALVFGLIAFTTTGLWRWATSGGPRPALPSWPSTDVVGTSSDAESAAEMPESDAAGESSGRIDLGDDTDSGGSSAERSISNTGVDPVEPAPSGASSAPPMASTTSLLTTAKPATPRKGREMAAKRTRLKNRREGQARLLVLNRRMNLGGRCRFVFSPHSRALAAEQCRDRRHTLTVFMFANPAAAKRYLDDGPRRDRLLTWDCNSMNRIGAGSAFTWTWKNGLPGRLLILGGVREHWIWKSIVFEC